MSTVEAEKSEIAALSAKLSSVRADNQAKDKELNELRNKVVALTDQSPVVALEAEVASLGIELAQKTATLAAAQKTIDKQARDLGAAGPALELVAAINAVKA